MYHSRDFPTVTLDKAEEFNNAIEELSRNEATSFAYYQVMGDYNYTSALFESMKVAQIIPRLKEHLARGRKAVIFHRRVESKNPLIPPFNDIFNVAVKALDEEHDDTKKAEKKKEIARLRRKYSGMLEWEKTLDLRMPREQLSDAFGKDKILFFSGKESKKVKDKAVEDFNDDNSGKNIIVIQEASGKEGISLHDTTGNHQRVLVALALPQSPITALQIEGRIYRIGNKSNAIFEYPLLGLNTELILFGQKFNQQVSTTENLALGSQARNLRESFARGVEEHSGVVDIDNQGVGGKEFDAPDVTETDAFDGAVLDYYTNQKLSGRRDDREGKDYYPTPEPLGFMMSQWGQIGEGESVLEPSAGHGAIARYVPRENLLTAIEPSQRLFSRLQVKAGGNGRRFENTIFENYNVVNKHDVVLMNPPFGTGGRLAVDHVAKAFQHLEEGGRIVAVIPRGSTDSKFDKWYNGQEDAVVSAEIGLPDITFERAGTSVNCRVVVIDKVTNDALRQNAAARAMHIDLSGHHYEKIEDFFDDLRDIRVPERTIDQKAKLRKKAVPVARELRSIKGINYVNLDDNGILVSGKGIYYNNLIAWDDKTGNDLIDYLAERYKTFDNEYGYAVRRGNELREAVYEELRSLTCKLAGMTEDEMQRYIDAKSGESVRFRMDDGTSAKEMEAVNRKFNEELQQQIDGTLPKGHVYQLGKPGGILRSTGFPDLPIELSATRLAEKVAQRNHEFEVGDVKNLVNAINDPIAVFAYGDKSKAQNVIVEIEQDGKKFVVGVSLNPTVNGTNLNVNSIRGIFPKKNAEWLNWINQGKLLYANKEKIQDLIDQQRTNLADVAYLDLDSIAKEIESFENPKIPGENLNDDIRSRISRSEESVNHAREERIMQAVSTLSEQLHVPVKAVRSVDELPANSEARHRIEQGRNVKAWFEPSTGEVTVYLPNAFDEADAVRSVLHETVGHRGLRELFGEEFDRAMMDIYRQLPSNVRREIAQAAVDRYKGNASVATEEYLSEQAEKDETPTWWGKVVSAIRDLLRRAGINVTLSENDVKYLLWRSRRNLERDNLVQYARDRIMRNRLGVERNREPVFRKSESESEEEMIIERAKRDGTYLKAPNGQPTNLTQRQWVQVRTRAFKKWFGDWEKAARIEKLRKSDPVEITGKEITPSDDLKLYKKNALEYGKSLRGEYTNKDTGEKISLTGGNSRGGIREILQHDYKDAEHLQSIAAIPQIIENAVFIDELPNEDVDKYQGVKSFSYYVCGLKIANENYTVKAVVANQSNGERYYDHRLSRIEKGELLSILPTIQKAGIEGNAPLSGFKDKRLLSILQTNSSKFVDENGEPKVFYHNTDAEFSIFNEDLNGTRTDAGWLGDGFYFYGDENEGDGYGRNKMSAFLNVRDPYYASEEENNRLAELDDREASKEFREDVESEGYDGVYYNGDLRQEAVVFSPNQIKSATDNNGDFSSENDDIRFRETRVEKSRQKDAARVRSEYEKRVISDRFLLSEGYLDSMKALDEFHKLIEKTTGKKVQDYENAYYAENALSSTNLAEQEDFKRRRMAPVVNTLAAFVREGVKAGQVSDWLIARHGVERNREMAVRQAIEETAATRADEEFQRWKKETAGAATPPSAWEQTDKRRQIQREARDKLFDVWVATKKGVWEKGYDWARQERILDTIATDNFGADLTRDYSGLSSRFGDPKKKGSTTEEAMLFVENFERDNARLCADMSAQVRAATAEVLDKQVDGGLMNSRTRERIGNMFRYYVPLRGWNKETAEDVYTYLKTDAPVFNAPLKTMQGRTSWPDDPLPTIANMAESGIMQANRNKMKQRFLSLVENHPTDLVSIGEAYAQLYRSTDQNGKVVTRYVLMQPDIPKEATAEEAARFTENFHREMEERANEEGSGIRRVSELGDIPYRVPSYRELNEHIVIVKRNGKDYMLTVNGNPRLAQAVNGLTNPDAETTGGMNALINAFGAVTRFMSANFTTRNPEFVASNYLRDMLYANETVQAKESPGYAARFHLNFIRFNPKSMYSLLSRYEAEKLDETDSTDRYFREFILNGGETGYTNLKEIDRIRKEMEKDVRDATRKIALRKAIRLLENRLDHFNRSVEICARFAAFVTSRQAGRSVARSVWDAKEITVNFNKKGSGGKMIDWKHNKKRVNIALVGSSYFRAFYAFFNAGIQGVANLGRLAYRHPGKVAAMMGANFALGMLVAAMGGDDRDSDYYNLPEFVRRSHICFSVGDKWITIPLPHGFKTFYGLGELTMAWMRGVEHGDAWDFAHKAGALMSQPLPVDIYGEGGLKAFVPTMLKPPFEAFENKDWTGAPIYRKNTFNRNMPEWTKAYQSTATPYVEAARFLNSLGGGNRYKRANPELLEVPPAVVEHIVNGYLGGVSTFASKLANTVEMAWNEDKRELRSIPVASRVLRETDGRAREFRIRQEFFENTGWMDGIRQMERGYLKELEKAVREKDSMSLARYRVLLNDLLKSEDYRRYLNMKPVRKVYDKLYRTYGKTATEEEQEILTDWMERLNDVARESYSQKEEKR